MPSFSEAITVKSVDAYTYSAFFPPAWCIGTVPHGGYVTSCFLSVARLHFSTTLSALNQPHTLTLHVTFLRRTSSGPAVFRVKDKKLGRQTSTIHISLVQGSDREEVVGYITNSNISSESGLTLPTSWSLIPSPYPVDFVRLAKNDDRYWKWQEKMPFAEFRKASNNVQFYIPRSGQLKKGLSDQWFRFSNGDRFTMESLGFVADLFEQVVEAYRDGSGSAETESSRNQWARFWYPTLLLNLEVKKVLPPEGVEWLFVRVRPKQIKNGRMDLEVVILDEGDNIVALSQHVCLILDAARNMAERKDKKTGEKNKL